MAKSSSARRSADVAQVGVVGVGAMGTAVAARLLASGYTVAIGSRRETAGSRGLVAAGARADMMAALAAPIVIDCLPDDSAVRSVFTPASVGAMTEGALHVNTATISIALADELETLHSDVGSLYLAAPVIGRPESAERGELQVVVAGTPDATRAARGVLEALAASIRVIPGAASRANLVKLAVNYNLVHAVQTLGASIGLVESGGIDATTFVEILTASAYSGSVHRGYGARISQRRYVPAGFSAANALKDLDLATDAARQLGLTLPMSDLREVLASAAGADEQEWSALAERYRPAPQPK